MRSEVRVPLNGQVLALPATMTMEWAGDGSAVISGQAGRINLSADDLPNGTHVVRFTIDAEGFEVYHGRFVSHKRTQGSASRSLFMSPLLREGAAGTVGEVRVVLKWDQHPRDLDLHCVLSESIGGRIGNHMYYTKRGPEGEVRLDRDDTGGNGNETLTLERLRPGVTYWIGTHHFSGEKDFTFSNATLEVYGLTQEMLRVAGVSGAFRLVVPNKAVEGCGERGVWQGFALVPSGSGHALKVANKLVPNTSVSAEDTECYKFS